MSALNAEGEEQIETSYLQEEETQVYQPRWQSPALLEEPTLTAQKW